MLLHNYLEDATRTHADGIAVQETDGSSISYAELADLSDRVRDRLIHLGVRPGDRVGVWIRKSIDSVATIYGILKTGAAYVPLDPGAPPTRNAFILADCTVVAVVVEALFQQALAEELSKHGAHPVVFRIEGSGGGVPLRAALDREDNSSQAPAAKTALSKPDDLGAILYTSGSTGKPKGVQLTHRNIVSFVEWCSQTFEPMPSDRFSSHAPFHFDLSLHDIYVSAKHGGTLILFGEEVGKNPARLAELIAATEISIWYSAPSILSLLAQFGDLGSKDYSALRVVLFAGEVFPVSHLRSLVKALPHPRYFNLYGPTETNVCTYYEVPTPIPEETTEPMPIGKVCSHLEGVVIDEEGKVVGKAVEGELCIRGVGVTRGYWNLPELSAKCFVSVGSGPPYYQTGDIVREESDGNLQYLGRRDRMIKKRGFRVELGEIEACLYRHPKVREAAVVALPDEVLGMKVNAHISCKEVAKLSIIELKTFCSKRIPAYMIPDNFRFHSTLPKTSTDKVDYQALKQLG
jgi:amino acid adenylation domain-containing protein